MALYYLLELLGTAAGLVFSLVLYSWIKKHVAPPHGGGKLSRFVHNYGAVLMLCSTAGVLLWPCLIGMMPQSQDHPIHLARAWHFLTRMLASGRLSGWSNFWFAGWPAGEDYPPGVDWWISAFYVSNFGLIGWEAAYAFAFVTFFAISALAVYVFGRTYLGASAGFFAGMLFLLDPGQYREGGWSYTVYWGVWPQVFSTALTLLSLARLQYVINRGALADFVICALFTGAAIVLHPTSIIYFGIGVPVYLVVRLLGGAFQIEDPAVDPQPTFEPAGRMLIRTALALGWGGALGAFWVVPFSAKGQWMAKYGELWKSLPAMAQGLWRGTLFDNLAPPIIWLGIVGFLLAVWRRQVAGIFVAIYGMLTLFLASSSAFEQLDLLELSPAFGQVQFQRLSIPAKMALFLLAGYAIQVIFQRVRQHDMTVLGGWRGYVLAAVVALSAAPFVRPMVMEWGQQYSGQLAQPKTKRDFSYWGDYQQFLRWSKDLMKPGDEFFRIAYVRPYNDHFFGAAPVFNGIAAYKVGYTPAINFIHKPDVADPQLYRLLSVKYVVAIGPLLDAELKLERQFGPIMVYRFTPFDTPAAADKNAANKSARRVTLVGAGRAEIISFEEEEIRVRVTGANADSRLILHVANYPNWRASVGGKNIAVETMTLGGHAIFVGVRASDGDWTFKYRWTGANWLGSMATWLALLVFGFVIVWRFNQRVRQRFPSSLFVGYLDRIERRGVLISGVVLAVAITGFGAKALLKKSAPIKRTFQHEMAKANVSMVTGATQRDCPRGIGDRFICQDNGWNYVGVVSHRIGEQLRRCIWAHPVANSPIHIAFEKMRLTQQLHVAHGLLDDAVRSFPAGADVLLEVYVDGQRLGSHARDNRQGWDVKQVDTTKWQGRSADVKFVVTTTNASGRHYCFDAWAH